MEIWKTIEGFNNYEVSNYGNVRKKACNIIYKNKMKASYKEKKLKKELSKNYLRVTLSQNNIQKKFLIHRLVALYFLNNENQKKCVNHIDGNKINNNYLNLEWCTHSENELHSYNFLGKININRKLNKEDIEDILKNCFKWKNKSNPGNIKIFADKYNVHKTTIYNVLNRKYYVKN